MKSNGKSRKSKKGEEKLKEEALLQAEQEEAERLEKERLRQEHLKKLEAKYQGERESELAELNSLEQKFLSAQQWKMDYREQAKWEHYLSCDGTPDPTVPQEINTFMSLWHDNQDEDVQLVMEKEEVVLKLIEKLESLLLETSPDEITEKQRDQYQEFILQLQDLLHKKYNEATQNLLKESAASLKENISNTDDAKETEEETEKNSDILDVTSQGEEAPLQEEPGGREEAPRVVDVQQLVPVGGVYHIAALQLPPQAQDVGDWSMVELLDVGLELYPYSPGEAEDGTQETVQITLKLPDNVIYFKVPVVARWEPAGQQWRTDGISNITYEAEEKSISFRMGAFYTVALLQDAHLNLPYQAWELHPTGVDEGLFTVTAVFATIQIQIKDNQCMLSSVVVEEEKVLSHITGKWMSPFALREALKGAGVNIFPAGYSPEYVPVHRKAAPAEVKAYEQMALLAAAFAFAHSKWNGEAGPERVVFKVSEHLTAGSAKDKDWSLYMFSGERVQNLKLTETSEAFSEELEEESEFHSTLYHMLKDSASSKAMGKVERAGFLFIDSVYQLLLATRILAYS
ncbi:PREDICTED: protein CASC1 isoform X3 [Sturnus vulgaris]|uniref:protein CASC1 isoform X3 n=1 Tax=Sturnus vulgaris TaxID=9172 RepID=UPI00071A39DC|nr:PREDICTED: protein CASC1 isoform X3 [Sturnus vulgaris]